MHFKLITLSFDALTSNLKIQVSIIGFIMCSISLTIYLQLEQKV